ncbi:MAG: hypothetical protein ACRD0H_11315, partial [Actinomycetes bacterium]
MGQLGDLLRLRLHRLRRHPDKTGRQDGAGPDTHAAATATQLHHDVMSSSQPTDHEQPHPAGHRNVHHWRVGQ